MPEVLKNPKFIILNSNNPKKIQKAVFHPLYKSSLVKYLAPLIDCIMFLMREREKASFIEALLTLS